jgi:hypothetical protein
MVAIFSPEIVDIYGYVGINMQIYHLSLVKQVITHAMIFHLYSHYPGPFPSDLQTATAR